MFEHVRIKCTKTVLTENENSLNILKKDFHHIKVSAKKNALFGTANKSENYLNIIMPVIS